MTIKAPDPSKQCEIEGCERRQADLVMHRSGDGGENDAWCPNCGCLIAVN